MEKFVIKRDSWHFKFLRWAKDAKKKPNSFEERLPRDFCSYWNSIIGYMIMTVVASLMLGVFVISVLMITVFLALVVYTMLNYIAVVLGATGTTHIALYSFGILFFCIGAFFAAKKLILKARDNYLHEEKTPGLIKTKYRSWREKYCPMIEYEKEG